MCRPFPYYQVSSVPSVESDELILDGAEVMNKG
jgi:hypothetical protein